MALRPQVHGGLVLSIGKLAAGQERYYEKQVAQGLDDYFTGRGESPGRWLGRGAAVLGLAGTVEDGQLSALMEGRDPGTDRLLREQRVKVAALDLTFSAPKSLSVLHALAGAATSAEIVSCHEEAVRAALGYLEETAVLVSRRGEGGLSLQEGGGFVAAAFRHRMSRALDPQLHTHCVAGNIACGPDGRWTALHHPTLFRAAKTAGYLYQAHLRALVHERLGLEWRPVQKGAAELVAIESEIVEEFSRRRHEMLRHAEASGLGLESRGASQAAALATRSRKQYGVETGTWREEVAARAAEHGLDRECIETIERSLRDLDGGDELNEVVSEVELFDRLAGPTGLTELQNTFDDRAVLRAVAESAVQGARVSTVRERGRRFARRRDVLATTTGEMTTAELTSVERRLVAAAHGRACEGTGLIGAEVVLDALAECGQSLNSGQRKAVEATVASGHGVQVIEALAGTGKTFTAGVLRHLYQQAGYQVVGVAPTGRAVRELVEQAGIPARTLDSVLHSLERSYSLPLGGVVVIDEAGMAPTRQTAVLLEAAERSRCKVIAIGDPGQLHSVQAGGWMRAVGRRVGTLRLSEVMRQREPLERRALAALHERKPQVWVDWARANDRITIGTGAAVLDQAVSGWHAAAAERGLPNVVLIARDNATREALNARARRAVHESGGLGGERTYGSVAVAVGDRVICRRNDHRGDVDNGTRGTVLSVSDGGVVIRTNAGTERLLGAHYVAAHLEHAYALTGHGIQGGTVESAFVVAAPHELTKGWSYTALSRARGTTQLFVITDALRQERDEVAPGERPVCVTDRELYVQITRYMRTRDDEDLAIEQLPAARPNVTEQPPGPSVRRQDEVDRSAELHEEATPTREGYQEALRMVIWIQEQLRSLRSPDVARLAAAERRERELRNHQTELSDRSGELASTSTLWQRRSGSGERANIDRALAGITTELRAVRTLRDRLVGEVGSLEHVGRQREELEQSLILATDRRDRIGNALIADELRDEPSWLRSALGDRSRADVHLWDRAAKGLARYRLEQDVVDQRTALGERPSEPEGQRRYEAAASRLREVRIGLGVQEPEIERPTPVGLLHGYETILGEERTARLIAAVELQLQYAVDLPEAELDMLAAHERNAVDRLDRPAAAQALRLEREGIHHRSAAERLSTQADQAERHASELGWRARHERQQVQHSAVLQREHADRHRADADRIDLELQRLGEAGRHPDQWLDRYGEEFAQGVAASGEIGFRRAVEVERRVQFVLLEPPAYIVELIGDRPLSRGPLAAEWERLAESVERLRLSQGCDERPKLDSLRDDLAVDLILEDGSSRTQIAVSVAQFRQARGLPEPELVAALTRDHSRELVADRMV